jgi:hypothetical protein
MKKLGAISLVAAALLGGCFISAGDDDAQHDVTTCHVKCDDDVTTCKADCSADTCKLQCDKDHDQCYTDCH